MKIRNDQIEAFKTTADESLAESLLKDLRAEYADDVDGLDDETIRRRIHYGLGRARRYEITRDKSLAAFVLLMFVVTPHFDDYPDIQEVLQNEDIKTNMRIKWVLRNTTNEEWDKVKQHGRKSPWPANLPERAR